MPGSRLFKDLLKRRKKGNEAPRGGPASVTTTKTPEQDGSSTVIRGGTSISTAERTQVGNAIPAADSQEAAVRPPANGTPEAESKEKFGMFYFTEKLPTEEQTIDLVAIHGLGGHYNDTWTDKNTEQNWLRDFLPDQVPQLRIMSWGYNSGVLGSKSVGTVTTFAQGLLADLKTCRATKKLEKRPLIFVCHSLGGVVFKRMLALANERAKLYQATLQSTKGVIFLGTPHDGSDLASMLNSLAKIAKVVSLGHTNSKLVEVLKSQGNDLLEISESFVERGEHLDKIYSFYEQEKMYGTIVVDRGSARIGLANEELVPMDCSHSTICKFSSADNRQYGRILSNLQELVEVVNDMRKFVSDTGFHKEVLSSLEKYSHNPRRHSISDKYQSTFHWIWKPIQDGGPGLVDWLEIGSGLFWIAGKPGAGKSTLMKYILEGQQTSDILQNQSGDINIFSFWFFELGKPHENEFIGFLHSLLYQLVRDFPGLTPLILPIYREIKAQSIEHDPRKLDWNESDTRRALKIISTQNSTSGDVCLFIDALDECDGGNMNTDDIDFIVNLQNWNAISIRICISSRPELPIELRLDKFSKLRVQQWTSGDIAKYVSKELQTSFELVYPQATSTSYNDILLYLTNTVVQKAEGVFLWVKLVVKDLKTGVENYESDDDLKLRLESLPKGIEDLYRAIFDKILTKDLHHAIIYLEALNESYEYSNVLTLLDMSFIDDGPQVSLKRPFAAIPIEERIERSLRTKGRVVRLTRNLLEFKEHSEIKDGYIDSETDDNDSDDNESSSEDAEVKVHKSESSKSVPADEIPTFKSHEIPKTATPGSSSDLPAHEQLLRLEVSFVHRTLREYTRKASLWEPIVQRAMKDLLVEPRILMLTVALSRFKTTPSKWTLRRDIFMRSYIRQMNFYIEPVEHYSATHFAFLESMFAEFKNKFSNWTELWGLPKDWGCDIWCILARELSILNLKEAFDQKRVDERYLPHFLSHYFSSTYMGKDIAAFQSLLQIGCQVFDSFRGRSAWEFWLWYIYSRRHTTDFQHSLEVCRIALESGADPNLMIRPISLDQFPLDDRRIVNEIAVKPPCYPLHIMTASLRRHVDLAYFLPVIKLLLQYGAKLDSEDADGKTVLENAAHCTFNTAEKRNLAPILLYLEKECEVASKSETDSGFDPVPRDTIIDLFPKVDGPIYSSVHEDAGRSALDSLLAKLDEEGYRYISEDKRVT